MGLQLPLNGSKLTRGIEALCEVLRIFVYQVNHEFEIGWILLDLNKWVLLDLDMIP